MTLSTRLWTDNSDLADEALAHPFVRGLGDGSLPRGSSPTISHRTPSSSNHSPAPTPLRWLAVRHSHVACVG